MPFSIGFDKRNTKIARYSKKQRATIKNKRKNKTKKKDKIVDIPFSKYKSKGTKATIGNIYFHYQLYSNINYFFSILNSKLKIKANLNKNHIKLISRGKKLYHNELPYLDLSKKINLIIIDLDTNEGKHANIAIVNNMKNTIEFYEPHGYRRNKNSEIAGNKGIYHKKVKLLKEIFENMLPEHSFIDVVSMNPKTSFQTDLDPDENTGFCVTWCILFVHYRLLNLNILLSRLIKHIDKTMTTTKLLKYAKYIEDTIKQNLI